MTLRPVLDGLAQVLVYLSGYTHRTAIGNERIKAITEDDHVIFTVRANQKGGDKNGDQAGKRRMRLPTEEFIRSFMLHILPGGIQCIRRYGVLANVCKKTQLAKATSALQQPAPNPSAQESAQALMARVASIQTHICPKCQGPLHVVQTKTGVKRLLAPGHDAPNLLQATGPPCKEVR